MPSDSRFRAGLRLRNFGGSTGAVEFPTFAKSSQFGFALLPADQGSMRKFGQSAVADAEQQVATKIIGPASQNSAGPVYFSRAIWPNGRQCFSLTEAASISLGRGIIVRMHHHRSGTVDHLKALSPAPAGVFIIFGVLHFFEKTAAGPDIFSQAAADHAEEVMPTNGFAGGAETA